MEIKPIIANLTENLQNFPKLFSKFEFAFISINIFAK